MGETGSYKGVFNNEALILYESATYIYVCKAALGAVETSAVWQIKRLSITGIVRLMWADGNSNFDNVATDLATVAALSYS